MKKLIRNIWELAIEVVGVIKNWKENFIYSIGVLLSALALGISWIGFIAAYVIFIKQGGYENQKELIAQGEFSNLFSVGTVAMLYQGVFGISTGILLLISLVFVLIYFFMNETVIKKVIVIIDMILPVLMVAIPILIQLEFEYWFIMIMIDLGIVIADFVSLIVIMRKSVCRLLFRHFCTAVIMIYCLNPLILYLLENIISVLGMVFVLIFVGFILFAVIRGAEGGSFGSGGSEHKNNGSDISSKKQETSKKVPQPKVKDFSGNVRFYRGKGGTVGIMVPTDDCIYFSGNGENHSFVCTVEDYEKGRVIIKLNGKQVTNI